MFTREHLLALSPTPFLFAPTLAPAHANNVAHIADLKKRFGSRLTYKEDSTGPALVGDFHVYD